MNDTVYLIPHYNNVLGLRRTLQSIIEPGVDVVIVDDGSRLPLDKTQLEGCLSCDRSLIILSLPENKGIESALNNGLEFVKGKYRFVARIDCGDLVVGNRIMKQRRALLSDPDLHLVGGAADYVDVEGNFLYRKPMPETHEDIVKQMHFGNAFCHPSVMFRTSIVDTVGFYPLGYSCAEDYAFFFKVVRKHSSANLRDVLIRYEVDEKSVSSEFASRQCISRIKIIIENFRLKYALQCVVGLVVALTRLVLGRAGSVFFQRLKLFILRR